MVKISIMLEEINFKYKVTKVNINNNEQFEANFKKLSPFSKIPVIIDHNNNQSLLVRSYFNLLGRKKWKILR